MSEMSEAPAADRLMQRIAAEYETLSKQLKLIAKYLEEHRQEIVLSKISDIAAALIGTEVQALAGLQTRLRSLQDEALADRASARLQAALDDSAEEQLRHPPDHKGDRPLARVPERQPAAGPPRGQRETAPRQTRPIP